MRSRRPALPHADSRLWRTLAALLFRPGFLTCEFLADRRARYLPPLRLYLVLSVFFFLVVGSLPHQTRAFKLQMSPGTSAVKIEPADLDLKARPGETPQQTQERVCRPDYSGPASSFVQPLLLKACRTVVLNGGRSMTEGFLHNAARAMFLFLPVLALVMMSLYWRPRRYYVEHLLFFVHNHAFTFLLLALLALLSRLLPESIGDTLALVVWLYIPYYLFVSMRRVYGQGRLRTLAKLTVLSFAYFTGMVFMLALTGLYSVWME